MSAYEKSGCRGSLLVVVPVHRYLPGVTFGHFTGHRQDVADGRSAAIATFPELFDPQLHPVQPPLSPPPPPPPPSPVHTMILPGCVVDWTPRGAVRAAWVVGRADPLIERDMARAAELGVFALGFPPVRVGRAAGPKPPPRSRLLRLAAPSRGIRAGPPEEVRKATRLAAAPATRAPRATRAGEPARIHQQHGAVADIVVQVGLIQQRVIAQEPPDAGLVGAERAASSCRDRSGGSSPACPTQVKGLGEEPESTLCSPKAR